eukprot:scaffold59278_cov83-Cyclotella_meneghiniana.AAC.1
MQTPLSMVVPQRHPFCYFLLIGMLFGPHTGPATKLLDPLRLNRQDRPGLCHQILILLCQSFLP